MAERIIQKPLDSTPNPDNDFIIVDSSTEGTRRVSVRNVANTGGPVTSVNGETGDVVIDADEIDDTSTTKKLVTTVQLNKIEIIKTDQGTDTVLHGDGIYRTTGINDAANIGTGTGVFASIASSQLQFKTFKEADDLVISADSDSITLGVEYNGTATTNTTIGGLPAGTNISGKSMSELFEAILCPYLSPAFTGFSITGQSATIEVGASLSGSKTFTWSTSNSGNITTNSVAIRDVTANTLLASSLANDGTESVAIGTITNTSPISQSWRGEAVNTNTVGFNSSNFSVSSIYPFFYGKVSGSRPTSDQTLVDAGTKSVSSSNGTLTITYSSTSSDYIWFAIPSTSTSKTVWYVSALNNGSIGGAASPGGNLFPAFDTVSIDSPTSLWSGVNYKIYVSNYPTAVTTIEFRNS